MCISCAQSLPWLGRGRKNGSKNASSCYWKWLCNSFLMQDDFWAGIKTANCFIPKAKGVLRAGQTDQDSTENHGFWSLTSFPLVILKLKEVLCREPTLDLCLSMYLLKVFCVKLLSCWNQDILILSVKILKDHTMNFYAKNTFQKTFGR